MNGKINFNPETLDSTLEQFGSKKIISFLAEKTGTIEEEISVVFQIEKEKFKLVDCGVVSFDDFKRDHDGHYILTGTKQDVLHSISQCVWNIILVNLNGKVSKLKAYECCKEEGQTLYPLQPQSSNFNEYLESIEGNKWYFGFQDIEINVNDIAFIHNDPKSKQAVVQIYKSCIDRFANTMMISEDYTLPGTDRTLNHQWVPDEEGKSVCVVVYDNFEDILAVLSSFFDYIAISDPSGHHFLEAGRIQANIGIHQVITTMRPYVPLPHYHRIHLKDFQHLTEGKIEIFSGDSFRPVEDDSFLTKMPYIILRSEKNDDHIVINTLLNVVSDFYDMSSTKGIYDNEKVILRTQQTIVYIRELAFVKDWGTVEPAPPYRREEKYHEADEMVSYFVPGLKLFSLPLSLTDPLYEDLGFKGSNKAEREIAEILAEREGIDLGDAKLIVLPDQPKLNQIETMHDFPSDERLFKRMYLHQAAHIMSGMLEQNNEIKHGSVWASCYAFLLANAVASGWYPVLPDEPALSVSQSHHEDAEKNQIFPYSFVLDTGLSYMNETGVGNEEVLWIEKFFPGLYLEELIEFRKQSHYEPRSWGYIKIVIEMFLKVEHIFRATARFGSDSKAA